MSKLDKLEVIAGTVVEVQIIERQLEAAGLLAPDGSAGRKTAAIIGRQRIFLDGPGVADPHYDFDRCELAVRREQEVAFARLKAKGGPMNVMLVNRTMNTHWPFAEAIDMLAPTPRIGATVKAAGAALAAGVVVWLALALVFMRGSGLEAAMIAVVAAVGAFLVAWVAFSAMRVGAARRRRGAVIAAVLERLKGAPAAA